MVLWESDQFSICPVGREYILGRLLDLCGPAVLAPDADVPSPTTDKSSTRVHETIDLSSKKDRKDVLSTRLTDEECGTDHYAILELKAGPAASDEDIRSAYRRLVVTTHPDKVGGDDAPFRAVQLAFDVLSDPLRRRAFDSTLPFDDTVPDPDTPVPASEFYTTFEPVFTRNLRFAVGKPPFPALGDETTPYAQVEKFYNFWRDFKSWRTFKTEADPTEGEYRQERRFLERKADRELTKLRNAERVRVRGLVHHAYRWDPRVLAHRDTVEAARKAEADAKAQLLREAELQKKAAEEAAAAAAAAAEAASAEARRVAQEELKQRRRALASKAKPCMVEGAVITDEGITAVALKFVRENATAEELDRFLAAFPEEAAEGADLKPFISAFNDFTLAVELRFGRDRFGQLKISSPSPAGSAKPSSAAVPATTTSALWTEAELRDLIKCVKRFPNGTRERWARIAEELGTGRTADEVLIRSRDLQSSKVVSASSLQASSLHANTSVTTDTTAVAEKDWLPSQQKELQDALRELKDYNEKDKWVKVAAKVTGKTAKQCLARFRYLKEQVSKN